jgi:hypothetical protein
MILDNEGQRELLLSMINAVNFSGKDLEQAYNLKSAIAAAETQEKLNQPIPTGEQCSGEPLAAVPASSKRLEK